MYFKDNIKDHPISKIKERLMIIIGEAAFYNENEIELLAHKALSNLKKLCKHKSLTGNIVLIKLLQTDPKVKTKSRNIKLKKTCMCPICGLNEEE